MRPSGLIYRSGKSPHKGEVYIALSLTLRVLYGLLRSTGIALTSFAILSVIFAFSPIIKQEVNYRMNEQTPEEKIIEDDMLIDISRAEETVRIQQEADNYGVNSYFSVVIPKIGATSNIVANIDASEKDEYLNALKMGVAHAKGTYFPGQGKRILLFSHSTDSPLNIARYNAIFYLLRKLEEGDTIIVYFADKKYIYKVKGKTVTPPSDTSWLTDKGDSETLLLMTCDPPGTTWNRLIVEATPLVN